MMNTKKTFSPEDLGREAGAFLLRIADAYNISGSDLHEYKDFLEKLLSVAVLIGENGSKPLEYEEPE